MPRLLLTDVPKDSTITATFEIITPMFLGDSDQKATAIRPTSIKGALRFWWRAMNGHLDLKTLAEKEAKLFGSTDGGGVFSLAVSSLGKFQAQTDWPPRDQNNSSSYMGYGLTGDNQNPHRESIPDGLSFDVKLTFQSKITDEEKQSIKSALEVFGLFGSLGSRARRGFGSVQISKINDIKVPTPTAASIKQWFKKNLPSDLKNKTQLEYTAFGSDSYFSILQGVSGNNFRTVHFSMGNIYKEARAFKPTRDRAIFGLPLKNVDENLRRSSPVFFKVIKNENGSFQGLVLVLPSQFHPEFPGANYQKVQPLLDKIKAEKCA
jgi:CRISPR-associated protein Cmr1